MEIEEGKNYLVSGKLLKKLLRADDVTSNKDDITVSVRRGKVVLGLANKELMYGIENGVLVAFEVPAKRVLPVP